MTSLCINIDNGPEWKLAKEQFARIGMEVERFPAIVEDNRALAFNKSVYAALSMMPEGGWLWEDDIMFDGDDLQATIRAAIGKLPRDFNTFHLGCNIIGMDTTVWQMPEFHHQGIVKLHNCWQSHATYYSKQVVEYILEHFRFVTDKYKTEGCEIFDDWLRRNVLSDGNSYLINPMIAYQRPRHSEIWNVHADYTGAHKQGNEWLRKNIPVNIVR